MANYLYTGEPTAGQSTKDIKIPKADGTFQVFTAIVPNTTTITATDAISVDYMNTNSSFSAQ